MGGRRDGRLGEKAAGRPRDSFGPPGLLISPRRALPGREGGETPGPGLQKATGHRKGPQVPALRGARCSPRLLAWWALLVRTAQTVEVFLVQLRAVCSTPRASQPRFPESVGLPLGSRCSDSSRLLVRIASLFYLHDSPLSVHLMSRLLQVFNYQQFLCNPTHTELCPPLLLLNRFQLCAV